MIARWTLHDPEGVLTDHTFVNNPYKRDDPEMDEPMQALPEGVDRAFGVMPGPPAPMQWSFSWVCYTLAELDIFETWLSNGRYIHVTDHHGQTWQVQFYDFDSTRKPSQRFPQRQDVTVHCTMFGKPPMLHPGSLLYPAVDLYPGGA